MLYIIHKSFLIIHPFHYSGSFHHSSPPWFLSSVSSCQVWCLIPWNIYWNILVLLYWALNVERDNYWISYNQIPLQPKHCNITTLSIIISLSHQLFAALTCWTALRQHNLPFWRLSLQSFKWAPFGLSRNQQHAPMSALTSLCMGF